MAENAEPNPTEDIEEGKKAIVSYAKYTGVAFQMVAIICVFAFVGYKLDKWLQHETQWITALSCIVGVCLSIYQVIRQLKQ
jgi:F0F1-type ATP synthase assembly protein I